VEVYGFLDRRSAFHASETSRPRDSRSCGVAAAGVYQVRSSLATVEQMMGRIEPPFDRGLTADATYNAVKRRVNGVNRSMTIGRNGSHDPRGRDCPDAVNECEVIESDACRPPRHAQGRCWSVPGVELADALAAEPGGACDHGEGDAFVVRDADPLA
jgi:hypothetical protein